LAKKGLKIKKVSNLGVDVIQRRGRSFLERATHPQYLGWCFIYAWCV